MTIEQRHDHKTDISLQHFVIVTLCRTPKCKNSKPINSKNRHFITYNTYIKKKKIKKSQQTTTELYQKVIRNRGYLQFLVDVTKNVSAYR